MTHAEIATAHAARIDAIACEDADCLMPEEMEALAAGAKALKEQAALVAERDALNIEVLTMKAEIAELERLDEEYAKSEADMLARLRHVIDRRDIHGIFDGIELLIADSERLRWWFETSTLEQRAILVSRSYGKSWDYDRWLAEIDKEMGK